MSTRQEHRARAAEALASAAEIDSHRRRIRAELRTLPRYGKCTDEQGEVREDLDARDSDLNDEQTGLWLAAITQALLAMSADEVSS